MQHAFLLSSFFLPKTPNVIRARVAICCSFFIQGLIFATWCVRIPDVKAHLGLNEAQLGSLLLMLPAGQVLLMLPNGWLVNRLGSRALLMVAGFLYPAVLVVIGLAPSVPLLAIGLFVAGFAANLSSTAANTQGVSLERLYKRSILALFHGMWSLAGMVAVCVGMLFASLRLSVETHFVCVALFAWCLLCFSGGALLKTGKPVVDETKPRTTWKLTAHLFWLGVAAMGCMACEGTIYDWSGVYLREVLHAPEARAGLGYFGYLCTMVPMRFVADRLINRYGVLRVLFVCGICISGGLTLAIFSSCFAGATSLVVALAGFALVGCGTSAVVPICCGLAGKDKHVPPSIAIAEISTIGFFGLLAAPPAIGYIAHMTDLRVSFGMMALVGLLVLLATQHLRRNPA